MKTTKEKIITAAAIFGSLSLAATSVAAIAMLVQGLNGNLNWPEDGIWKCSNEFNNATISFDTEADDNSLYMPRSGAQLSGTNLETGEKFTMEFRDNWVCTLPSGKEHPMLKSQQP